MPASTQQNSKPPKTPKPISYFWMGIIGLQLSLTVHSALWWFTDFSFWMGAVTLMGLYMSSLTFFFLGLGQMRREDRLQKQLSNEETLPENDLSLSEYSMDMEDEDWDESQQRGRDYQK
jgi:hypothetical protein